MQSLYLSRETLHDSISFIYVTSVSAYHL